MCALFFISLILFQSTVADIRVVNSPAKQVVTTVTKPSVSRAGQTWNPRWHPGKQSPTIEASKKAAIAKLQKSKALAGAVPFLKKVCKSLDDCATEDIKRLERGGMGGG